MSSVSNEKSSRGSKVTTFIIGAIFLFLFFMYIKIAALTTLGPETYIFDFIERFRVLGVDDIYRYYFSKSAWSNASLYSWSYIQPVGIFLDGSFLGIFGNNIFLLRVFHVFLNVTGLIFLYKAGVKIGLKPYIVLISVLTIALMPLYIFVSISTLGEGWLACFLCFAIFLYVSEKWLACALVTSLLPLVRPEGLLFLMPLLLFFARKKDVRKCLILLAPGFLYLLYIIFSKKSIFIFSEWRFALRHLLDLIDNPLLFRLGFFSTFNPFWLIPAFAGFFFPKMRRFWPLWIGAWLWLLGLSFMLTAKLGNYEPRYLLSVLPICAIGAAVFFQEILYCRILQYQRVGLVFLFCVMSLFVILEDSLQLDYLRGRYNNGERWPFKGITPRPVSWGMYGPEEAYQRVIATKIINEAIVSFPGIDTVLISNPEVLLTLDPENFARPVKVVLIQVDNISAVQFLNGWMLGIFPEGKQYAYFSIIPETKKLLVNALYVGAIVCHGCQSLMGKGDLSVYTVAYKIK
jgi:hypothetical protein